ncbi:MAG: hypothetical protein CMH54_10725 [Myxococcales bacterium]|nr:hypothetical protein [Myxococcales bacterium]|tara:strand:+ start:888 stop:1541 length:654 start_codon:yes stop_codon:yes gene_type:complete
MILFGIMFFACAGVQKPAGESGVISILDLDCASCGGALERSLAPDVLSVKFRKLDAELVVRFDPKLTTLEGLTERVRKAGFKASAGGGKGHYVAAVGYPADSDVRHHKNHNERIDLDTVLVPGKYTIIDFTAAWCGPCRKLDEALARIVTKRKDIAVRKIDIYDWGTVVANQHLKNVPELPYVIIYGPDGKKLDAISGLHLGRVRNALGIATDDESE